MNTVCKSDPDEVIFISERPPRTANNVVIDKAKRLALQREIDEESYPKDLECAPVQRSDVKMKIKEEACENEINEDEKIQKEQTFSPKMNNSTVANDVPQSVEKKRKEDLAEVEVEKKKKRRSDIENGNDQNESIKEKLTDQEEELTNEKKSPKAQIEHEISFHEEKVAKKPIDFLNGSYVTDDNAVMEKKTKKDKHKKEKTSAPKIKNSTVVPQIVENKLIEDSAEVEVKKKGKKKKRRSDIENDQNESIMEKLTDQEEEIKNEKKSHEISLSKEKVAKKAKGKKSTDFLNDSYVTDENAVLEKKTKKDKEAKKKKSEDEAREMKEDISTEEDAKMSKKDKKKRNKIPEVSEETNDDIKTKKKRKRDVTEDDESIKTKKKKTDKLKLNETGDTVEEPDGQQTAEVPKKSKKKRHRIPEVSEEKDDNIKTKKKSKQDVAEEDESIKTKKKKTAKLKFIETEDTVEELEGQNVVDIPKKDKKKRNKKPVVSEEKDDDIKVKTKRKRDVPEEDESTKSKKKKTAKLKLTMVEETDGQGEAEVPKKGKKKRNKIPVVSEEKDDDIKTKKKSKRYVAEEDESIKSKKKKTAKLTKSEDTVEEPDGQIEVKLKKKKKKKKNEASLDNGEAEEENSPKMEVDVEVGKTKQKKKEKKAKKSCGLGAEEETQPKKEKKIKVENLECEESENVQPSKKRKENLSVQEEPENVDPDSSLKTKSQIKEEEIQKELDYQNNSNQEVIFLSAKNGNVDEATINRERRQALQLDIDMASQPQLTEKTGFGQWGTAHFESSQQKQKFLKLMGGFKQEFRPAASASAPQQNMALGKEGQEHLRRGLMGVFQQAQYRQMGGGLGFGQPSNRFFIDINASRSVRFDD
ncbi:uncharacterized protein knop1 isoform X1 [Stigmatopora nigra]